MIIYYGFTALDILLWICFFKFPNYVTSRTLPGVTLPALSTQYMVQINLQTADGLRASAYTIHTYTRKCFRPALHPKTAESQLLPPITLALLGPLAISAQMHKQLDLLWA